MVPAAMPLVLLELSTEHCMGTGYSPRARQEQRVVAVLSLHPGALRVMHPAQPLLPP